MGGSGLITSAFFNVLTLLLLALTCFKVFVFIDAAIRPSSAYIAAGKLTKVAWLLILGISAFYDLKWGGVTQILTIVGTAAAIIYMVDVRPALKPYSGGRGGGRLRRRPGRSRQTTADRRHDGPYGPW